MTSLIREKSFKWDFENKKGLFYNRYAIWLTSNSKNQIQVLVLQSTDTATLWNPTTLERFLWTSGHIKHNKMIDKHCVTKAASSSVA